MPFTGPFEDRLAIHELVASYGDAVTRRDADAWIANWSEDCVWKLPAIPGMERVEGKAAISQGMACGDAGLAVSGEHPVARLDRDHRGYGTRPHLHARAQYGHQRQD